MEPTLIRLFLMTALMMSLMVSAQLAAQTGGFVALP